MGMVESFLPTKCATARIGKPNAAAVSAPSPSRKTPWLDSCPDSCKGWICLYRPEQDGLRTRFGSQQTRTNGTGRNQAWCRKAIIKRLRANPVCSICAWFRLLCPAQRRLTCRSQHVSAPAKTIYRLYYWHMAGMNCYEGWRLIRYNALGHPHQWVTAGSISQGRRRL